MPGGGAGRSLDDHGWGVPVPACWPFCVGDLPWGPGREEGSQPYLGARGAALAPAT
jgi:hypothetical protein